MVKLSSSRCSAGKERHRDVHQSELDGAFPEFAWHVLVSNRLRAQSYATPSAPPTPASKPNRDTGRDGVALRPPLQHLSLNRLQRSIPISM
jgi:hypothetical protein